MFSFVQKIILTLAVLLLIQVIYEFRFKNDAQSWMHNPKPEAAAYVNLEQDKILLERLKTQTAYNSYKTIDPSIFDKQTIFNPITSP